MTAGMRTGRHWPAGIRLVVSISMQFEAGGEPDAGAPSLLDGFKLREGFRDYPTTTW